MGGFHFMIKIYHKHSKADHSLVATIILLCCFSLPMISTPDILRADNSIPDQEYSDEVIEAFYSKVVLNPIAVNSNPYWDNALSSWYEYPEEAVCAVQYAEDRKHYIIATFENENAAEERGFIVTHKGHCGTCSTLQDLATYLAHPDLTTPVRRCSALYWFKPWSITCLENLGFTYECAETWYYNALNTAKECFKPCIDAWLNDDPLNNPDGSLNDCLSCDEENSGPIFKYVAGRTRRNSGIPSAIDRPAEEIYPIIHDYY
jgi:hypothetical protein